MAGEGRLAGGHEDADVGGVGRVLRWQDERNLAVLELGTGTAAGALAAHSW